LKAKRKHKIEILLVLTISFLLPLLPAWMGYYVLMEADFLSTCQKFENPDLDCLLLCKKHEVTTSSGFSHAFWGEGNPAKHFYWFSCHVSFPQPKTSVLRC